MFQHILIPVDFTEKNGAALDVAFEMALRAQSRITLLHVIERIEYAEDTEMREFYDSLEAKSRQKLESMTQRFADADLTVHQHLTFGRRAAEIVRPTIEQDVDLVVLSSHRIDREDLAGGWATLSYQVSILCPCAVLLVK